MKLFLSLLPALCVATSGCGTPPKEAEHKPIVVNVYITNQPPTIVYQAPPPAPAETKIQPPPPPKKEKDCDKEVRRTQIYVYCGSCHKQVERKCDHRREYREYREPRREVRREVYVERQYFSIPGPPVLYQYQHQYLYPGPSPYYPPLLNGRLYNYYPY